MILPGLDRQDWDKDMLVGDELADALTEYAAIVARIGSGDRVKINAFSAIGESTEVTVVFTGQQSAAHPAIGNDGDDARLVGVGGEVQLLGLEQGDRVPVRVLKPR
jgi:hypothetical protein